MKSRSWFALFVSAYVAASGMLFAMQRAAWADDVPHADAAAPSKVLRHLSFDVAYDSSSSVEIKVSGFEGSVSGTSSGTGPSYDRHGTIVVDVVAATSDGGLVVDVSEDAGKREAPIRVGISAHALLAGQSAAMTDEERMLLHYLARDLIKSGTLTPAMTWNDQNNEDGMSEQTTYRIISVDSDAKTVSLAITGARTVGGPHGYQMNTTGDMTYDTGTVVPLTLSLATRTTMASATQFTTIRAKFTSTLREDSFRKT